jgi:hypothetical protein
MSRAERAVKQQQLLMRDPDGSGIELIDELVLKLVYYLTTRQGRRGRRASRVPWPAAGRPLVSIRTHANRLWRPRRAPRGDEIAMATRVADFVLIQDHESVIGPNGAAGAPDTVVFPLFDAPGAVGNQSVLAFRVLVTDRVELTIRFNGAALITEMVLQSGGETPRTFHELISQTEVREEGNRLEMSLDFNRFPQGQIRVSDVVLWYRRLA